MTVSREEFGAGVRLALIGASGMGALAVLLAVVMGAIWVALALLLILGAAVAAWAIVERRLVTAAAPARPVETVDVPPAGTPDQWLP